MSQQNKFTIVDPRIRWSWRTNSHSHNPVIGISCHLLACVHSGSGSEREAPFVTWVFPPQSCAWYICVWYLLARLMHTVSSVRALQWFTIVPVVLPYICNNIFVMKPRHVFCSKSDVLIMEWYSNCININTFTLIRYMEINCVVQQMNQLTASCTTPSSANNHQCYSAT